MKGVAEELENPFVREIVGGEFCRVLELMDICTEEAERAGVLASMPTAVFMALRPGDAFARCLPCVYRSHVRELLTRYTKKERLDLGTEAEVLLGLVETSLKLPLNQAGAALYHALFLRVMGEEVHQRILGGDDPPHEQWKGQIEEFLYEARRKAKTGRPRGLPPTQTVLFG